MTDKNSQINTLEDSPKFKELVLKIFSKAKIRVRTYKLNELEQEITKLHTKEIALENFFVPVNIAGIEHQLPKKDFVSELSTDLAKLAKLMEVQVSSSDIEIRLDGFSNSYSLIPLIDNYVFAYTNTKVIKNGGLLVIKLSAEFGRKVFSVISKAQAEQAAKEAKAAEKAAKAAEKAAKAAAKAEKADNSPTSVDKAEPKTQKPKAQSKPKKAAVKTPAKKAPSSNQTK